MGDVLNRAGAHWEPRLLANLYAAAAVQADDAHGEEHDLITQHYGILKSDLVVVVDLAAASIVGRHGALLNTATVRAVFTRWLWAGSGTPSSGHRLRTGTRPALRPTKRSYGPVVARMTALGGWCVEPLVVDRRGRVVHRFRVTRMGDFVGEVASPQQLARLGVPVAELVEEA